MTSPITLLAATAIGAFFGLCNLPGPIPPTLIGALCVPAMTIGYWIGRALWP